jgi:hypothetical protein
VIDRVGRSRLALQLRRLASGRLTNAEFDSVRLDSSQDEALVALGDAGWSLYDDSLVYRLRGRRALAPDTLEAVARCVLFLDSDLPYEWPPLRATLPRLLATLITFGASGSALADFGKSPGHITCGRSFASPTMPGH